MPMFAISAAMATTQILAGQAANTEGKYNASLFEQQAGTIDIAKAIEGRLFDTQRDITTRQYQRAKGQLISSTMAATAGAGLEFSGTPAAVLIDSVTQMGIDESIDKYNIEMSKITNEFNRENQKISAISSASEARRKGKAARNMAYSNAFSTLMQGAYYSGSRGFINTSGGQTSTQALQGNTFRPRGV